MEQIANPGAANITKAPGNVTGWLSKPVQVFFSFNHFELLLFLRGHYMIEWSGVRSKARIAMTIPSKQGFVALTYFQFVFDCTAITMALDQQSRKRGGCRCVVL